MIIECPECQRKYRIDDSRVPAQGTVARCSACGHRFQVLPSEPDTEMACPKCGAVQPPGDECVRCGVIFRKIPPGAGEGDTVPSADPVVLEGSALSGSSNDRDMVRPVKGAHVGDGGRLSVEASFSLGGAIRFGWEKAKTNLGFFAGFLILGILLMVVPGVLADMAAERAPAVTAILFRAVAVTLEATVTMGFIKVGLRVHDGEKPELSSLLDCLPLFFKYFLATLLYGLIVLLGVFLLIVPGIVWAIKYMFYGYFIVDSGKGSWEALKSSGAITKDAKLDLFLFILALSGINLLGLLALGVGLFVTIPLSVAASAFVFRSLQKKHPAAA